jgi:hypothetical protein
VEASTFVKTYGKPRVCAEALGVRYNVYQCFRYFGSCFCVVGLLVGLGACFGWFMPWSSACLWPRLPLT